MIESPDQMPDQGLGRTLQVARLHKAVDQALGMDPTGTMAEDIELAGTIADDHCHVHPSLLRRSKPGLARTKANPRR